MKNQTNKKSAGLVTVPLMLTKAQVEQLSAAASANFCTLGELIYALATMELETCAEEERVSGDLTRALWLFSSGRAEPNIEREWLRCGFREEDVLPESKPAVAA